MSQGDKNTGHQGPTSWGRHYELRPTFYLAMIQLKYETVTLGVFSSESSAEAECRRAEARVDRSLSGMMVESWVESFRLGAPYKLDEDKRFRIGDEK